MSVRIVPLGGLGEIGLNCLAIESDGASLVVDCGLMFPSGQSSGLGVEYVVPDLSYLRERADTVKGVLVTHAHEDHIGALPYLLAAVRAPVFGSPFTLGRVRQKLDEMGVEAELREISPRETRRLGAFGVEAVRMTHSVPQALAFAVETSEGVVIHTGDFKIDERPVGGRTCDLERLDELGRAGVLALLSDSTNAEREGWSVSESDVGVALHKLLAEATGRVVVALFGSHVDRVSLVARAAAATGRRVALCGSSLLRNCALAESMGILERPPSGFLPLEDAGWLPPRELALVTTGAQGEPRAGLSRLALDQMKELTLEPGDTVVLSSRAIPGNEVVVSALINLLCKKGVRVVAGADAVNLHASGHGHAGEQRRVLDLTRPKVFVPIHGEYRMLARHAETARAAGVGNALLAENGQVIELAGGVGRLAGEVQSGRVYRDGGSLADVGEPVLRDRRQLGQDGIVVALVVIDRKTGEVVRGPELWPRGVPQSESLVEDARRMAAQELAALDVAARSVSAVVEEALARSVKRAFKKQTERRPVVLPVVVLV